MTQDMSILTKQETADLLKVSRKTLDRWEKDGLLVPFRIGVNVRYRREDVETLIAGQRSA